MAQIRHNCVVCDNELLTNIATFSEFPTMAISKNGIEDSFYTKQIAMCDVCGCAQLRNLVDPQLLYSPLYTNITFSPVWKHHNLAFAQFIFDNSESKQFMEIGANTGALYGILNSKITEIDYSVLDMYKHDDLPTNIPFYQGNCESFEFDPDKSLILSHVFEHLYNPIKFLENVRKYGVKTLYIAIPNFDRLLEERSIILLHSQHTFFCGKQYIDYLFSKYGYFNAQTFVYDGAFNSYMLKYEIGKDIPLILPDIDRSAILDLYVGKMDALRTKNIIEKGYLMPSGIYGQFNYYHISNKSQILGFLDNNEARHGQRLYGTDKYVFLPQTVDLSCSIIYLCDCPYKEEIMTGLINSNKDLKIINL